MKDNRIVLGFCGRWIIVNASNDGLAWSGSRWVRHANGIPLDMVQVCNFASELDAKEYAVTNGLAAPVRELHEGDAA
jgi:hypothetical protein